MVTQAWRMADAFGFTPAVDPRRSDKTFALSGRNFFFDAIGPKSGFGNRMVSPLPLGDVSHIQGFRVTTDYGDRAFTMSNNGISEWVESLGVYRVLWIIPNAASQPYRWSMGYLNGYVYFAHPAAGYLLALDVVSGVIQPVDSDGVPENILSLCISNARVCLITNESFAWSGPSDGLDWTPRLSGAGIQLIGNHVAGQPISVSSYGQGCLVWTTGGVMRAEFRGDQTVFNFRALNTEFKPINSMCIQQLDDQRVLILDERGLYVSAGAAPEPYAPLFNEFLIDWIRRNKLKLGQNLRLEWDSLRKLLFLSYSFSESNALYEQAFVYYPPTDKWGTFNEGHFGFLPVRIDSGNNVGDYFGFVDSTGFQRYWTDAGSREIYPDQGYLNVAIPNFQVPAFVDPVDDCLVVSSSFRVSENQDFQTYAWTGFYERGSTVRTAPQTQSLDAELRIGLLRFDQVQALDMMTEVNQLMIGSGESALGNGEVIDYNLIPAGVSDEDWNVVGDQVDYGLEPFNFVNCKIRVISTVDGKTEFNSETPVLFDFQKGVRYYALNSVGIWHILELVADEIGEDFHLAVFELTASTAGHYA